MTPAITFQVMAARPATADLAARRWVMLLRRTLATNAAFTGLSAIAMAVFGPQLASFMGLDSAVPLWIAAGVFVPYAVLLALSARRPRVLDAALFVAADLAYVAACVGLAAWPGLLSGMGKELVVLSAVAVLFFVAGQWIGLKRLQTAG
jgi:hypothetical protein